MGRKQKTLTVEDFMANVHVFVCECFYTKQNELKKLKSHWNIFGAGIDLGSKTSTLDIVCKGCGKCFRVIYDRK